MMLRSIQAPAARLANLVQPRNHPAFVGRLRYLATSAALHKSNAVAGILSSASKAQPLKDAVKFYGESSDRTTIWSYRDLERHVFALSSGLQELGYAAGDKIVLWLPTGSTEYAAIVLATANIGITVVTVEAPADPNNVIVSGVVDAIRTHAPKMVVFGHEFQVAGGGPDDGIVAGMHSVLNAIAPGVSVADASGLSGFSPLTGKPFASAKFPSLRHVVHTGDAHVRGAVTFRSLLAYNGACVPAAAKQDMLILKAEDGKGISGVDAIKQAEALGGKMGLSNDHNQKNGKLVIRPSTSPRTATAMLAAVMHESLWISPGADGSKEKLESVSANENALVVE